MAAITTYGLAQETRVTGELCKTYNEPLLVHNVTPEKHNTGSELARIMQEKETAALNADTAKQILTRQEDTQRANLVLLLQGVNNAVKTKYGKGSKEGKDFHIGEKLAYSTPKVLQWAADVIKVYPKYKDALAEQGIVQADIDAIAASAAALEATDTQQETSKRAAAQATAAADTAKTAVVKFLDSIQNAAGMAFVKEPATKADFEAAKKLRYQAAPRTAKDDKNNPPSPGTTTQPADKTK
jgi:hypothetical protein